ncbi:MAG: hypothetical protein AAGL17_02430 [Cyanobacteria bacterium J06576_12]
MGRIRTILEIGLAGGAAIGILALSLPRFLGGETSLKPSSTVPVAERKTITATAQPRPDIAHFLGIAQFIKSPTQYGFVCGVACDSANEKVQGEVVSASLEGDHMEIEYRYLAAGKAHVGKLIGTLNSDGVFAGVYRTDNNIAATQGDITFTFAADGSAKGSTNAGSRAVKIFL